MDLKLLAWGMRGKPGALPRLWLFTDDRRLPDPRPSVSALPSGRAGVILRHDHDPSRAALGRDLARICRARRLLFVVAGDPRLAASLRAGIHLRGGRRHIPHNPYGLITSSAHSIRDLRRARAAGASLVFLSPAFPTVSHAGAPGLGPLRWAAVARQGCSKGAGTVARHFGTSARIAALGGIDGQTMKRLPSHLCVAVGAIGALSSA